MASGLFYELIAILEGECWHEDLLAVFFHYNNDDYYLQCISFAAKKLQHLLKFSKEPFQQQV